MKSVALCADSHAQAQERESEARRLMLSFLSSPFSFSFVLSPFTHHPLRVCCYLHRFILILSLLKHVAARRVTVQRELETSVVSFLLPIIISPLISSLLHLCLCICSLPVTHTQVCC